MSNDVTPYDGVDPFEEAGRSASRGPLLKFSKGDWLSGTAGDVIPVGTVMVAAVDEIECGWLHWNDGHPDEERLGRVIDGHKPAPRSDLGGADKAMWSLDNSGKPQDPWRETWNLPVANRETGEAYLFTTSSKGGIGAVRGLCGAYGKHRRMAPDEYPVIKLGVDSYMHSDKTLGRIKVPTLEIVGWVKKDAAPGRVPAVVAPAPTQEQAPAAAKPAARRGKKAEPQPALADDSDIPW